MTIDWASFAPVNALLGGVMIGLSAALLLLLNGRIAGISGIIGGLFQPKKPGDFAWRLAFVLGLIAAPLLYQLFASLPESRIDADRGVLVVAGLFVGLGSRIGSGCTSGHGVCGISRLSPRSLIATLTFMSAGFLVVYVARHLLA
jgi:uncharacterized membrane protein YedE/YeeE